MFSLFKNVFKEHKILFFCVVLCEILLVVMLFIMQFIVPYVGSNIQIGIIGENIQVIGIRVSGLRFFIELHASLFDDYVLNIPLLMDFFKYDLNIAIWYSCITCTAIAGTIVLFYLMPDKKASLLTLASAMTIGAGTYFFPTFIDIDSFNITPSTVFWISVVVLIIGISLLVIRISNMLKDRKVNPDFKLSCAWVSNFMLFTCCLMCAWPILNLVYVPILLLVM